MTFADLVTAWLKRKQLTPPAAGYRLGCSAQTVRNWRRGKSFPTRVQLPVIAHAMGLAPETLARAIAHTLTETR